MKSWSSAVKHSKTIGAQLLVEERLICSSNFIATKLFAIVLVCIEQKAARAYLTNKMSFIWGMFLFSITWSFVAISTKESSSILSLHCLNMQVLSNRCIIYSNCQQALMCQCYLNDNFQGDNYKNDTNINMCCPVVSALKWEILLGQPQADADYPAVYVMFIFMHSHVDLHCRGLHEISKIQEVPPLISYSFHKDKEMCWHLSDSCSEIDFFHHRSKVEEHLCLIRLKSFFVLIIKHICYNKAMI